MTARFTNYYNWSEYVFCEFSEIDIDVFIQQLYDTVGSRQDPRAFLLVTIGVESVDEYRMLDDIANYIVYNLMINGRVDITFV